MGEVTAVIYRPTHIRQRLRYNLKLIGCTETCLAMYADAVTFGGLSTTEKECRELSGEWPPDTASPGLNLTQVDKVAAKLRIPFTNATGRTWEDVEKALSQEGNRRVIAQVWYADLGGTPIGHAILLQGIRQYQGRLQLLGNDPMKTAEQWWDPEDVRKAMQSFGVRTGLPLGQLRFGMSDQLPYMAKMTA